MTPRELIILLMGFLMVAVLLRGLFVAIQVRRGQIRLTIDKNIPKDFDLEELELAELPSGGARVVNRAGHAWTTEVESHSENLDSFEVDSDTPIPILMDVVESDVSKIPGFDSNRNFQMSADESPDVYHDSLIDLSDKRDRSVEADDHSWSDEKLKRPQLVDEEGSYSDVLGSNDNSEGAEDIRIAEVGDYRSRYSNEPILDEAEESSTYNRSIHKECSAEDFDDYPENEWYEDEEVPQIRDGFGEEPFSDSKELDNSKSFEQNFENIETTNIDAGAHEMDRELDPVEQNELSEPEDFEHFSMTAGERIGFDENSMDLILRSDNSSELESRETQSRNKKPVLGAFLSIFRSKPNTKTLLEKKFESESQIDQDRLATETEQTELIKEIEGFIDQSDNHFETPKNYVDSEEDYLIPDSEIDEGFEADISSLDNVTSIENATAGRSAAENSWGKSKVVKQPVNVNPIAVLTVSIMSSANGEFYGEDLVRAFKIAGFEYGDMGIFHLYDDAEDSASLVCSLANAIKPGTFELDTIRTFSTVGISLFLTLPTSGNNLRAFDKMITVAQQLCKELGGELKDDHRSDLTAQTIEHYRQRIRDFELDQLRVAGGRI